MATLNLDLDLAKLLGECLREQVARMKDHLAARRYDRAVKEIRVIRDTVARLRAGRAA